MAGLLGSLCTTLSASAETFLAEWNDFDALMDEIVATRPDIIYPPGDPLPCVAANPSRLSEWYFLRRRDRVAVSLALVPADCWDDYRAAWVAAITNRNSQPPGEPVLVPPADTNRVAFARVSPPASGTFGFNLYTPADLPVDIFAKTSLRSGPLWNYAGTVWTMAPFTPSAVAARIMFDPCKADPPCGEL